jgi:peptidyl-prolyl cis-trans isomerase SurA
MNRKTAFARAVLLAVLVSANPMGMTLPAFAEGQGVVAVVNDQAITELDITQRIALLKIVGDVSGKPLTRKRVLQMLIDEQIKIAEAKKFRFAPTDAEITAHIERVSKGMGTSSADLEARLRKQGVGKAAFRSYVGAQIGFNRIISSKYRADIKISAQDVDRKFASIKSELTERVNKVMSDPRMKPVTVYTLMEINLPVEADDAMLLQARAVEAAQVMQRLKGCGNVKAASSGVFNVKAGKQIEADASKLPKELKAALDKAGPGRAVGPMRVKNGIQLLAYCGSRKLTPPKPKFEMPTRQQVENALINEKYDSFEEDYMKTARNSVYIEYRDNSYSQ